MDQPGIDDYMAPIPGWMLLVPILLFALARLLSPKQVARSGHMEDTPT